MTKHASRETLFKEPVLQGVSLSRRTLLKAGGALVVSFALPLSTHEARADSFAEVAPGRLDSWLAVAEDGTVTGFTGRIDMGTGVETVYTQAVAEELDVAVSAVRFVMGDTARTPEQGKSTASNSVTLNLPPMRQAAAEARFALLEMGAKRLGAPAGELEVTDGVVRVKGDPSRSVSYGQLIGGKRFDISVTVKGGSISTQLAGRGTLKDPAAFKLLGTSVPRVDIPAKVRGAFTYVHDVVVDGMLHGTVVLPPERGAALVSVDGFARPIPGIVQVVTKGNFVGVVAETEQAAVQARDELKVTWSKSAGQALDDIYSVVRNLPIVKDVVEAEQGDLADGLSKAETVIESVYHLPFNTHGMMGPSCAVADCGKESLTIWSGTQWPDGTRRDVAEMVGLPAEKVRVIWVEAAGSYGRLGTDDAAADAALLSQAVGRPVRVQWQRGDEHMWSPFNPGAVIKVRAGLDRVGKITAWDFENWSASHSRGERGNTLAWRALGTNPDYARLSGGADKPSYAFETTRVVSHYTEEAVRAIYMRSVGGIQNTFAIEAMMDELAAKAGIDPVEFRMRHLPDARMKAVLAAVAEKAQWKPGASQKLPAGKGVLAGRGVALNGRGGNSAYIATIADVEFIEATRDIYVRRVFVGFDAGKIINPDGLRNQIEGGTIMGLSRALKEEVKFEGRTVTTSDWASYPVLQFSEVPESIEIVMLDTPNTPMGAGEPPNVTPAAAVANALFAATGVRVRSLPLTPDRLKGMLKA